MKSKVYFTKDISPEGLIKIYEALGVTLPGKVAVKISKGEPGGHNFLQPSLIGPLVKKLNGTIVECNTAYPGNRSSTENHWKAIKDHGFLDIAPVELLDENGEMEIPASGKHLGTDIIGAGLTKYDSVLNLAHFKGHAVGGFGGVLKNQSIGFGSRSGKTKIHSAGKFTDPKDVFSKKPGEGDPPTQEEQNAFLESMAEAANAVANYMDGKLLYIDVMNKLSVDCDCSPSPEDPCMNDIGILASADPVAVDQACIDLIWSSDDRGRDHFIERVERQNGRHILPYAESLGLGSREYELISID